jgi:hypothetical protein
MLEEGAEVEMAEEGEVMRGSLLFFGRCWNGRMSSWTEASSL